MATVKFLNENKEIRVSEGTTILEAARKAGISIESPCNGTGVCGKCKVKLAAGRAETVASGGRHRLPEQEVRDGYVLACETGIYGDITVDTSENRQRETLKILDHGKSFVVSLNGFIRKEYDAAGNRTCVFGGKELLGTEEGDTTGECFGAVADIGTTTLVVSLVDMNNGKELDSVSALNPQAVHAQDVLSRIKLASEDEGLDLMYTGLLEELNRMISALASRNGINHKRIYEMVYSGNTCMLHLAANINPGSLGKFPYNPAITGNIHLNASEHRLGISDFGIIYLPPVISAYVGADITSGVLASQLYDKKGITLFVDIGTNGEMVIGLDGRLSATSTAAGPAFEGMNITHGMRAGAGAVEFFNIEEDGSVTVRTIGDKEAVGICGSGLLDIVGELVAYGAINKNGKLAEPAVSGISHGLKDRFVKQDGKTVFKITREVVLTQKDVRQVQLAKGAVRAGIEFLLKSMGVKASDVDRVLIAGSFGYHLRAKSLINIGLLPAEFEGRIEFLGNTSKTGGNAFLLNKNYRALMAGLVKKVDVLELANYKDFDRVFVSCLNF